MRSDRVIAGENGRGAMARVQWGFRGAVAVLALLECWTCIFYLNLDGVFYLDMGDQYWKGNWDVALNPYCFPLYGLLTGLMFRLTGQQCAGNIPKCISSISLSSS